MKIKTIIKENRYLIIITVVAFILRVIGVSHSLPFIYNVDEPTVVRSAIMLRDSLNPGHFDWPHFYYYINGLFYAAFVVFRKFLEIFNLQSIYPLLWQDPTIFYLISRLVTVIFSSITIVPVYKSVRLILSKKESLKVALIFALIPYHIFISSFAVLEPAMLFFIAIATYYILKIYLKNVTRDYILAGLFIGLASSIKYNAVFTVFPFIFANLFIFYKKNYDLKRFISKENFKKLSLFGVFLIGAFLITSPFVALDFKTFIRSDSPVGFFWQAKNLGRVALEIYPYLVLKNLLFVLPKTISISVWAIFIYKLAQFVYMKKRKATEYIALSFIFFYILYVSQFERQSDHYFIPLYIFIIIFCLDIFKKIFKHKLLLIGFVGLMLIQVVYFKVLIVNVDSRTLASTWIEKNIGTKTVNVLQYGEYFPVLNKNNIKLINVDEFFYNDLAGKDYPEYIVWSNYNLWPEDIHTKDWQKIIDRTNKDGVIKRYSGFLNLGPNIEVFHPNW